MNKNLKEIRRKRTRLRNPKTLVSIRKSLTDLGG
jgi:hypothetical protein